MALLFVDGFDHYATADLLKKWTDQFGSGSITSAAARHATGRGYTGSSNVMLLKALAADQSTLVFGLALRMSTLAGVNQYLMEMREGSDAQIGVRVTDSGSIEIYRAPSAFRVLLGSTAAGVLTANAWAYIELKVLFSQTVGTVTVKVNGVEKLALTGQDTCYTANAYANSVKLQAQSAATHSFDDVYVSDGNFYGDIKIETLRPNLDGTYSHFTPSTGVNHAALVDDDTPDGTTYNASDTVDQIDTYEFENLTASGNVLAVAGNLMAVNSEAGSKQIAPYLISGAVEDEGTAAALSLSQQNVQHIWDVNPDGGAAWSQSAVNALEFGAKITA